MQIAQVLTRGVHEVLPETQNLQKLMSERRIRVYLGIDPTGSLLTLGHSVVLRKLQQFAELGHDVILLIGNGTVKIGDPTGKDVTRPVLTDEIIAENFKTWKEQASKVLDFSAIQIKHNGDWLDKLNFSDLVKLMAKTTVQQLMERDMFQERLKAGRPIHGHEIMYPLLQGYDSVAMDVDLEIGGSDQTFNMMMGRTLMKSYLGKEKWVLTTPIINGTDGRKMSKSLGNYIALTEAPNDMYGKLMSVADAEILTYFTLLTNIEEADLASIDEALKRGDNPMTLKKELAYLITKQYHTAELAKQAAEHFEKTVQKKEIDDNAARLKFQAGVTTGELVRLVNPDLSNGEIKRLIAQGSIKLYPSGRTLSDFTEIVKLQDGENAIKVGKRHSAWLD